ncbi:MAG: BrnA antitoxin family protein [Treponema sp.]|nr:BrnA antitoxin family protein [Treponema sp.]
MAWLKKDGKGYQTRMNAVLRSAMEQAENAGRTDANKVNYGK